MGGMYRNQKVSHLFLVSLKELWEYSYSYGVKTNIEMIPMDKSLNEQWDLFENAATYSYARSTLEKNKNKDSLISDDRALTKAMTILECVYYITILKFLL